MSDAPIVILKTGDAVRIRPAGSTKDEWAYGVVVLASENGRSIAIAPDENIMRTSTGAWLGGVIPLSIDPDTRAITDLIGNGYDLDFREV